jgi:DNA-binding NarL/FixJ family response regulator
VNHVAHFATEEETPSIALCSEVQMQTSHPRLTHLLLLCDQDGNAPTLLNDLQQAELCTAEVSDLETLFNVLLRISPDLVVLTKGLLEEMLTKERRHIDPAEDLECALIDLRPRDADVIRMLAKGLRNHEIASSLGLRVRTVKSILSILYLRHDVTNRTELLGLLMEQGHSRIALAHQETLPPPQGREPRVFKGDLHRAFPQSA